MKHLLSTTLTAFFFGGLIATAHAADRTVYFVGIGQSHMPVEKNWSQSVRLTCNVHIRNLSPNQQSIKNVSINMFAGIDTTGAGAYQTYDFPSGWLANNKISPQIYWFSSSNGKGGTGSMVDVSLQGLMS